MKGLLLAFCILSLATMGSAAHLSMNQMAMIWKQNNGMDCQTAVAIGWATSMGDTKGRTPSSQGGMDRGLWGINSMRSPQVSRSCAFDAGCSATAAITQSMNGADWSKFTAFINGMHMPHMRQARRACGPSGFDEEEEEGPEVFFHALTTARRLKRHGGGRGNRGRGRGNRGRGQAGEAVSMEAMAMIWKMQGGQDCKTAVAVGWATSMGDPESETPSRNGGTDRGLWGINSINAPGVSTNCAFDAECCAKAAMVQSMNGADWSKFSAFINGMHMPHMPLARAACGPNGLRG
jgi:hypothetical protein